MLESLQLLHFYCFLAFFVLFGILEYFFPLRKKVGSTKKRWLHNIGLSFINTFIARFLLFTTPISIALYVEIHSFGILNLLSIQLLLEVLFGIILLDCIIYFQHRLAHALPWFWRLHSIHHCDTSLDVTTGLRFHTLEIIISLFIKTIAVILLGLSPITIVIFEIILVVSAMFNHANIKLPKVLDGYVSKMIVTPNFHQVHHSVIHSQTNSNYGFFLSIWDKVFNTYTPHNFTVKKLGLDETRENLKFRDLMMLDIQKK